MCLVLFVVCDLFYTLKQVYGVILFFIPLHQVTEWLCLMLMFCEIMFKRRPSKKCQISFQIEGLLFLSLSSYSIVQFKALKFLKLSLIKICKSDFYWLEGDTNQSMNFLQTNATCT